jgi:60 kDa SS-A/Ro ribonucleoprotein
MILPAKVNALPKASKASKASKTGKKKGMTKQEAQQARLKEVQWQKEAFERKIALLLLKPVAQVEPVEPVKPQVEPVEPVEPQVEPVEPVEPQVEPESGEGGVAKGPKTTQPPMMGRGWGKLAKAAFSQIYNGKLEDLVYLVLKYQNREGWSHKDVLRLAHIKPKNEEQGAFFNYLVNGPAVLSEMPAGNAKAKIMAFETLKTASVEEAIKLIRVHRFPRECLPTQLLNDIEIWRTLFLEMPMTALLRNLGKLTALGILTPKGSPETSRVVQRFTNEAEIKKARLHPFNILVALKAYAAGGEASKGSIRYTPVAVIADALDKAYELAFANVEPTGKRCLLGMDVSGSMSCGKVIGSDSITPREAAAALAMLFMRKEPACTPVAFSDRIVPFPMNRSMTLDTVCRLCDRITMGGTYCDLPMTWALENRVPIDVFMIFTDCETATRSMTPAAALKKYREVMGIDAKLIVFGFTSTGFTLADPQDSGMLDMVGFDASAPEAVREFMLGRL